jgi:hypothetical protein
MVLTYLERDRYWNIVSLDIRSRFSYMGFCVGGTWNSGFALPTLDPGTDLTHTVDKQRAYVASYLYSFFHGTGRNEWGYLNEETFFVTMGMKWISVNNYNKFWEHELQGYKILV